MTRPVPPPRAEPHFEPLPGTRSMLAEVSLVPAVFGSLFYGCLLGVAFLFLASAIVLHLWNTTLPGILRVPPVGYWQAFRLTLLCWLLFGAGLSAN